MFRNLERAENTARLVETGFRIALTSTHDASLEWQSLILTTAATAAYSAKYEVYDAEKVVDFLLRDQDNPNSVRSIIGYARDSAKTARTALTSEVWIAVNETWMLLTKLLADPVEMKDLPAVLSSIRHQSSLVRGALYGTMLRNDIYDFCRLGTFIERFDNTARIIDVKYYTLLPSPSDVGGEIDTAQWETILRSVSAHRSFRWASDEDMSGPAIAKFLMLDKRLPRSLSFCAKQMVENLSYLQEEHPTPLQSLQQAKRLYESHDNQDVSAIFDGGLHEFLELALESAAGISLQIEADFQFNPPVSETQTQGQDQ